MRLRTSALKRARRSSPLSIRVRDTIKVLTFSTHLSALALTITMAESISGYRTPPQSTHYFGDYPRLSSVRAFHCRRYEYESGAVELWEAIPLQKPLTFEARLREKCLVAQGVARGAIRIVREFKPRSLEALVYANKQVLAIQKPQVCK